MDSFETIQLGEKEQEVADPVMTDTDEKGQEVADPEEGEPGPQEEEQGEEEREADGGEQAQGEVGDEKQSLEQRRKNAALRRSREEARREAEIEASNRAAQQRIDRAYADAYAGKVNPYTGKPILSEVDYKEYAKAYEEEQLSLSLKSAGISQGAINAAIDRHPIVQEAREAIEKARTAELEASRLKAQEGLKAELKAINALDPAIKSLDDLIAMDNADQYFDVVKRGGLSLSQAYKLVNFDALTARRTQAARQSAINKAAGKGHLTPTPSRGTGPMSIPHDTLDLYRELFPGKSDSDFAKHYSRHNKTP